MGNKLFRDFKKIWLDFMYKIGIIGSSGFVGKIFIQKDFNQNYFFNLFENKTKVVKLKNSKIYKGDLTNIALNQSFFVKSDVVINFSNPKNCSSSISLNLIKLCEKYKVKKLIHISTCEVFGRLRKKLIMEEDPCFPVNTYQKKKKEFEDTLLNYSNFTKVIILRPTVVFGQGGQNLKKIIQEIKENSFIKNYLKASLFKNRKVNLVSVNYLCEVINFMITFKTLKNQLINVSQCSEKNNNYYYIYEQTHKILNLKIKIKPLSVHPLFVKIILFIFNFSIRIDVVFDNQKLLETGFKTNLNFEKELNKFLQNAV